jgi:nicotinamide mononucleotide transporter
MFSYIWGMHVIHWLQTWWQQQTFLDRVELFGVATGLLCVLLAALNKIWNWPIAIVSVVLYMYVFHEKKLFADMGLQVYFFVMNIYGWYYWSKKPVSEEKAPVSLITMREIIYSIIATVVFTVFLGSVLRYTSASYPYLDSFCAAGSLVAQVFLSRKVLENWLIWIFVDIIYVGIYIFKQLDATAIMYAVYVGIAIWGYYDWRREYRTQLQQA